MEHLGWLSQCYSPSCFGRLLYSFAGQICGKFVWLFERETVCLKSKVIHHWLFETGCLCLPQISLGDNTKEYGCKYKSDCNFVNNVLHLGFSGACQSYWSLERLLEAAHCSQWCCLCMQLNMTIGWVHIWKQLGLGFVVVFSGQCVRRSVSVCMHSHHLWLKRRVLFLVLFQRSVLFCENMIKELCVSAIISAYWQKICLFLLLFQCVVLFCENLIEELCISGVISACGAIP